MDESAQHSTSESPPANAPSTLTKGVRKPAASQTAGPPSFIVYPFRGAIASARRGDRLPLTETTQVTMYRRHDLRTLADRRSNPFDRPGADIADGENTGTSSFQLTTIAAGIGTGQHKALRVECHSGSGKPIGIWLGADEQE